MARAEITDLYRIDDLLTEDEKAIRDTVAQFIDREFIPIVGRHFDRPLSQEEASAGNPVPSTPESIERGRMLFMNNCSQCHGETGRGDGPLAATLPLPPANLYDHIPFHPDQFFFGVMTRGLSGVMPAFETCNGSAGASRAGISRTISASGRRSAAASDGRTPAASCASSTPMTAAPSASTRRGCWK